MLIGDAARCETIDRQNDMMALSGIVGRPDLMSGLGSSTDYPCTEDLP